jgi:hypothetical protein
VHDFPFDVTQTLNALDVPEGMGVWALIEIYGVNAIGGPRLFIRVDFDDDTFFTLTGKSNCPPTNARVSMKHELLSRMIEAISDKCLQLRSTYYGRTDSLPTAYESDGCGSLRALTSGLYVRRAETPTFFMSMKECFESLRAIDNIGYGFEKQSNGDTHLRVEGVRYFYQDFEILRLDGVNKVETKIAEQELFNIIRVGYEKWEAESVNSLDEIHSTREYRPSLTNVKGERNLLSKFIAGGYIWELCRIESFAKTGAANTRWDNDTFIVCVKRDQAAGFEVEQGNILNPANIIDPPTIYNYRINPILNLMRHFKSLAGIFPNQDTHYFIFNAGTGNIIAQGEQESVFCKIESHVMSQNDPVSKGDFLASGDASPLFRPELVTFDYPLSIAAFNSVRANPYGYISYRCNSNETFKKAYLFQLKYRITHGMASFELRNKY